MRHPKLLIKLMKGAAIHPRLRMFSTRANPSQRNLMADPIQGLSSKFHQVTLSHGLGIKTQNHKVRKPLKFIV